MPSMVISSFDYDLARHALDVEFVSGRRYRYLGVPDEVAAAFGDAFAKGRFFNERVRDRYPVSELHPEPEEWSEEWA